MKYRALINALTTYYLEIKNDIRLIKSVSFYPSTTHDNAITELFLDLSTRQQRSRGKQPKKGD